MKKLVLILTFMCFFGTIGCEFTPLVGPIVKFYLTWREGEAQKYYRHDSTTLYRAVKRSLRELDMVITTPDDEADSSYYLIAGENNKFKITVTPIEPRISKLSVRINYMGDKPYAELLYKKVDEQLSVIEFGPDGKPNISSTGGNSH